MSLKRRPERLKEFYSKYPDNSEGVIVFEAIDGKQYSSYDLDEIETQLLNKTLGKRTYNLGAFGCFVSHYRLWKMLADNPNLDDNFRFIIYEDDAFFVSNHKQILESALAGDVPEFDILYIGGRFYKGFFDNQLKRYNNTNFYKTQGDRGTFSYIISKAGARKIIENIRHSQSVMDYNSNVVIVDTYLNNLFNTGKIIAYDLFPHINWSPINYKSDIQGKATINKNFIDSIQNQPVIQHVIKTGTMVNKPRVSVKKPVIASKITLDISVSKTTQSLILGPQRTHRILRK